MNSNPNVMANFMPYFYASVFLSVLGNVWGSLLRTPFGLRQWFLNILFSYHEYNSFDILLVVLVSLGEDLYFYIDK